MGDHIRQPARPVGNTEISVTEPAIAIGERAAPFAFGHVVVKMHVNALFVAFGSNSVEDLRPEFSALILGSDGKEQSDLQSLRRFIERWIVRHNLTKDFRPILLAQRINKCGRDGYILATIFENLVD